MKAKKLTHKTSQTKPKENNQPKKNSFVYKPKDSIFNSNFDESDSPLIEAEFNEHRGR